MRAALRELAADDQIDRGLRAAEPTIGRIVRGRQHAKPRRRVARHVASSECQAVHRHAVLARRQAGDGDSPGGERDTGEHRRDRREIARLIRCQTPRRVLHERRRFRAARAIAGGISVWSGAPSLRHHRTQSNCARETHVGDEDRIGARRSHHVQRDRLKPVRAHGDGVVAGAVRPLDGKDAARVCERRLRDAVSGPRHDDVRRAERTRAVVRHAAADDLVPRLRPCYRRPPHRQPNQRRAPQALHFAFVLSEFTSRHAVTWAR